MDNEHSSEINSFLAEMARQVASGSMSIETAFDAVAGMMDSRGSYEITDMFRTAMYVLGRDDIAEYVQKVSLRFIGDVGLGAAFAVVKELETPELESEILNHGNDMRKAITAVMAAGNLRVEYTDTGIDIVGLIREPQEITELISKFNSSFEQEFGPVQERPDQEGWKKWM